MTLGCKEAEACPDSVETGLHVSRLSNSDNGHFLPCEARVFKWSILALEVEMFQQWGCGSQEVCMPPQAAHSEARCS